MSRDPQNLFSQGGRLAFARGLRNLSQADLAARIGKKKLTIGRWERGPGPIPSLALPVLSEMLGVRLEWLRDGKDPIQYSFFERSLRDRELWAEKNIRVLEKELNKAKDSGIHELIKNTESEMFESQLHLKDLHDNRVKITKWLQSRPDREQLESMPFYGVRKIFREYEDGEQGKIPMLDDSASISSSRKLLERVLKDDIKKILKEIRSLTDDQVANISTFLKRFTES